MSLPTPQTFIDVRAAGCLIANMIEILLGTEQRVSAVEANHDQLEGGGFSPKKDGLRLHPPVYDVPGAPPSGEHREAIRPQGQSSGDGLEPVDDPYPGWRSWPSGTQTTGREDFKTLVAEVSMGHAGAIFALEVSRWARSCLDWHRLLELCALTRTLVVDEDGCYDPSDFNDALLLGIKGTLAYAELHLIRARLQGGKRNKAERGELRFPLPVGLSYDELGRIELDPDREIQGAVRLVQRGESHHPNL